MENPFKDSIVTMLKDSGPWSEHQLLSQLVKQGQLDTSYGRDSLALFQAHFLTMNALYAIQSESYKSQRYLRVSALKIEWLELSSGEQTALANVEENLRAYYGDWQNFAKASSESVEGLLDSFWKRFLSQDEKQAALEVLKLVEPVDFTAVKKRYRELAMQLHPDRGGSDDALASVNDAYETLKRCYR